MEILSIIGFLAIAVLILCFMIAVHELGHYLAGKLLGFKINEFAIGMGKILFKRTNKKTGEVFTLRAIPLGGFCSFEGDDGLESKTVGKNDSESTDATTETKKAMAFNEQPPWKRLIVLFSGAFFNFLSAILFAMVLLMIVGYNQVMGYQNVDPESKSGLPDNGIIHAISLDNGETFEEFSLLHSFSSYLAQCGAEDEIILKYEEGGVIKYTEAFKLIPLEDADGKIGIGISGMYSIKQPLGFFELLWKSTLFCFEIAWLILSFLWGMITGQVSLSGVGGPIATVSVMTQSLSNTLLNIFLLVPMISVNLALFNLLPIPALDGARMVFTTIEWVRGKPVNPEIEGRIHMIGLIILFGLVFLADFNYLVGGLKFILYNRLLL